MKDNLLYSLVVVALVLGVAGLVYKPTPRITLQTPTGVQEVLGVVDNASRMTNLYVEQTLEVAGATTLSSGLTLSGGDARIASMVVTGAISTYTATSSVTAAEVCDSAVLSVTATTGTPLMTLPSTTTLFADCLTTNGDSKLLQVLNASATTGTLWAAGTGGTLLVSASTTVQAADGALLRVIRDSANTYKALLINAL